MVFNVRVIVVALLGVATAACSVGPQPSNSEPQGGHSAKALPVSSGLPSLGATSDSLVLPLTPYYPSAQDQAEQQNLQNQLVSRCAQRAGFNYPVVVNGPQTFGGDPGYGQFYDFGVTSLKFAKVHGYHDTSTEMEHHTASGVPVPSFGSLPAAEQKVVQSCLAQIMRDAKENSDWGTLVQELGVQAWDESKTSTRMVADFKKWSACMAGHGFDYATPLQALAGEAGGSSRGTQWQTPSATQLEITTATTDVQCKDKVVLIPAWIRTVVGYQRALLQKNLPRLRANLAQFNRLMSAERKLVGQ